MRITRSIIAIFVLTLAFVLAGHAQTVLTSMDGSRVDVEGQRGKVVVLAVGAAWLPLSAKQAEYTNALAKKYANKNVVIYFVATDSTNARSKNFTSNDDIKKFALQNKLTVSVLRDADGTETIKKFKVDQVPSFVILDKNGVSAGEPFGGIDPKFDITIPMSRTIDKLL